MKKSFIAILLTCSMLLAGCGDQEESKPKRNPDVREACWGDDIETVAENETAEPLFPTANPSSFQTEIYGCDAVILYYFDDDYGLYEVSYSLTGIGAESSYEDYLRITKDLTKKYGKSEHKDIGLNIKEEYGKNPAKALSDGVAMITDSWESDAHNTEVFTVIRKDYEESGYYSIGCQMSCLDFEPEESST